MTTLEILDRLQGDALKDGELRRKLLATRLEKDPLTVFCRLFDIACFIRSSARCIRSSLSTS